LLTAGGHDTGVPPPHLPFDEQNSPVVQKLPSSQRLPVSTLLPQTPAEQLANWH